MRLKNLVPLVAILVILLVLVVLKQAQERPAPIEEAVQLEALVPEDLSRADVRRLELFAGPAPDDRVTLVRAGDGGQWLVASHFDAPVDDSKIREYLDLLTGLKGELRQADVADESLGQYTLTEDEAFHVVGYTEADQPVFTLLVGKDAGPQNVFVRAAGSSDVYVVNANPRNEAGVWQDDMATAPEAATWVDKSVLEVEQETINRIVLSTPARTLALVRQTPAPEEPAPQDADEAGDAAEAGIDTADGTAADPAAEDEPPEPAWTVAQGGPGTAFKPGGADRLARTLSGLTASDVVDPAKKADFGLDPPMFTATIGLADVDEDITLRGGRPSPDDDGYIEVTGRDRAVVYQLSKYTFEQVFALGNMATLFEMPGLGVQQDELARVAYPADNIEVTLAIEDGAWALVSPKAPLAPQTNTLNTMASSLASWRPTDYADALPANIDAQWRTLVATTNDDASVTLHIGPEATALSGVYARVGDDPQVWVMRESDLPRVAPPPNDLYQRSLFDIAVNDITEVSIQRGSDTMTLERNEDGWSLTDDAEATLDQARIDTLLTTLADLQAETIRFGQTALDGEPSAMLRFTADGADHALQLAQTGESAWLGALPERGLVVTLRAIDVADIAPTRDAIRASATEPEEHDHTDGDHPGHDHADGDHEHGHAAGAEERPEEAQVTP